MLKKSRERNALDLLAAARAAAPSTTDKLPEDLARSLRGIPARVVVCRDVDRLLTATRRAARGGPVDLAVDRHLAACARCARVYGALHALFATPAWPLPEMLRRRLRRVVRWQPPRLPWLADARLVLAASLILSVLLTPVVAQAATRARASEPALRGTAVVWLTRGAGEGRVWWLSARRQTVRGLGAGEALAERFGVAWKDFFDRTQRVFDPARWSLERAPASPEPIPFEPIPGDPGDH